MIAPKDLAACEDAIRTGSYSFHAASRLLPSRVRDPALALYAFCRLADDAVDEGHDKLDAVLRLRDRLDAVYADRPHDAPADRAFAAVVADFEMPRTLPEALLEGLAWDADGRRCATLSDVFAYSARVAAAVGAMMCVLMRRRAPDTLARACDIGVAMQLTNIARDVGEDARAGRVYLPLDWLAEAGITPEGLIAQPAFSPAIGRITARLLGVADELYQRGEAGVGALPLGCRPGIYAARHIYSAIGGRIARAGHDSINCRAHTNRREKLALVMLSAARATASGVLPIPAWLHAPPLPEVAFLVEAAARTAPQAGRSETLIEVLAQLEAHDRARKAQWAQDRGLASGRMPLSSSQ